VRNSKIKKIHVSMGGSSMGGSSMCQKITTCHNVMCAHPREKNKMKKIKKTKFLRK
jgi:hypothetical protein